MAGARVKFPNNLETLMRSEMEMVIKEANLGEFDTYIAKRYLLDQWAQIDIAAECGCGRSTISCHVERIFRKVEQTAEKMHLT